MIFFRLRHWALLLSGMAMLSFMGRTFIDYGYVFPEMGIATADLLPITFGVLAVGVDRGRAWKPEGVCRPAGLQPPAARIRHFDVHDSVSFTVQDSLAHR